MDQAQQNQHIAEQWFAAFNAHDLEAILRLYDDNAIHYSPKLKVRQPETGGYVKGKDALRAWWKDSFERIPSLRYLPQKYTANNDRVFMEYIRKADHDPDMPVAEVLEVASGLIVASRVYHG